MYEIVVSIEGDAPGTSREKKFPCRARILLLFRFESMKSLREQARPFPPRCRGGKLFPEAELAARSWSREATGASRCHPRHSSSAPRRYRDYIFFRATRHESDRKFPQNSSIFQPPKITADAIQLSAAPPVRC